MEQIKNIYYEIKSKKYKETAEINNCVNEEIMVENVFDKQKNGNYFDYECQNNLNNIDNINYANHIDYNYNHCNNSNDNNNEIYHENNMDNINAYDDNCSNVNCYYNENKNEEIHEVFNENNNNEVDDKTEIMNMNEKNEEIVHNDSDLTIDENNVKIKNKRFDSKFIITAEFWKKYVTRLNCRLRLKRGWTQDFNQVFEKTYPFCVLKFMWHKCYKHKKQRGFTSTAVCKNTLCNVEFEFTTFQAITENTNVTILTFVSKEVDHKIGEDHRRFITGEKRLQIRDKLKGKDPSRYLLEQLNEVPEIVLEHGNLNNAPNLSIIQKINSEGNKRTNLDKDDIIALMELKEQLISAWKGYKIEGYIQEISLYPIRVILFSERVIRYLISITHNVFCYLDATGSIVLHPGKQKHSKKTDYLLDNEKYYKPLFYYALVLGGSERYGPLPVAECLTDSHDILSITHFLNCFQHATKMITSKKVVINKVETDFSFALIQAAINAFNKINLILRKIKTITKSKDIRILAGQAITTLIHCNDLEIAATIFSNIVKIFGKKYVQNKKSCDIRNINFLNNVGNFSLNTNQFVNEKNYDCNVHLQPQCKVYKQKTDSNASVENWFKIVKTNIFKKKLKLSIVLFIQEMSTIIEGNLKHRKYKLITERQKGNIKLRNNAPEMVKEHWVDKRARKSVKNKKNIFFTEDKLIRQHECDVDEDNPDGDLDSIADDYDHSVKSNILEEGTYQLVDVNQNEIKNDMNYQINLNKHVKPWLGIKEYRNITGNVNLHIFNFVIDKIALQTLSPNGCIEDNIINAFLFIINTKLNNTEILVFDTHFYEWVSNPNVISIGFLKWASTRKAWNFQIWLIPIFRNHHWTLLVVDFNNKYYVYFDSLHGSVPKNLVLDISSFIDKLFSRKDIQFNWSEWVLCIPNDILHQGRTQNCGIHLMIWAYLIISGKKLDFENNEMDNIRQWICEILFENDGIQGEDNSKSKIPLDFPPDRFIAKSDVNKMKSYKYIPSPNLHDCKLSTLYYCTNIIKSIKHRYTL
ncbi:uncharacterized protein [Prorops nasuta]|uniref:uncharacterized protein n=1 Tax=Prorops nasuta TaxID=863751 RepID=UPI0034CF7FF5